MNIECTEMLKSHSYFSDLTEDLNHLNNTNMSIKYVFRRNSEIIVINIFIKIHQHLTHKMN